MSKKTLDLIEQHDASWVDLRFTDTKGKEQHVSIPAAKIDEEFFEDGQMFDGSSIAGWKGIQESDMILKPDDSSAVLDPFSEENTINLRCDILEPNTMQSYERDPRSLAQRAEAYLQSTGIGDQVFFGPEPEFFVFNSVRWDDSTSESFYKIDSDEGYWERRNKKEDGNMGHRPRTKGGYFPVPPVDSLHDIRASMCAAMADMGLDVEVHHHEVGSGGQCEIGTRFNTLVRKADEVQILKYCVHNVAANFGLTATFMPKPLVGDNGSGMHVHQSILQGGNNVFVGDKYAGLSDQALYYIGGIIKHARALNAFTNPGVNSYRRLVPGFEAPVMLAYSARNRSAAIRIPHVSSVKAKRIETRFPDPLANPYLAFSALMMAGLDGIMNKVHPGEAMDKDLYDLPAEEAQAIPTVCSSLEQALEALQQDHEFLLAGDVFSTSLIGAYIDLKMEDVDRSRQVVHPIEFDMYYSS